MKTIKQIDHSEIRFGQAMTIAVAVAGYITGYWEIIAGLGAAFLATAISFRLGPFNNLYRLVIRPLGIIKPDLRNDHAEPHRFGQAVGVVTAMSAVSLILSGYTLAGWSVVWVLVALTALSFSGWCIGCFIYYMLNKTGIGGFFKHTPTDPSVITGARPRKSN